jgi:hypothetical protein
VGNSVGAIFKQVVRLGLADTGAIRNAARPIAMREVSFLSPVRMVRRGYQAGRLAGVVKVLRFEFGVAQQRHQSWMINWRTVFKVHDPSRCISVDDDQRVGAIHVGRVLGVVRTIRAK